FYPIEVPRQRHNSQQRLTSPLPKSPRKPPARNLEARQRENSKTKKPVEGPVRSLSLITSKVCMQAVECTLPFFTPSIVSLSSLRLHHTQMSSAPS
ncbi:MAG: hypothetical protein ACK55I_12805, partial [bacterium]